MIQQLYCIEDLEILGRKPKIPLNSITLALHLLRILTARQTIDIHDFLQHGFEKAYYFIYLRMAHNYVRRLYLHVRKWG